MSKYSTNYHTAFNTAAGTYIASSLFKRFKPNSYGSYTLHPGNTEKKMARFRQRKRFRSGTKTKRRRGGFRRGRRLIKRVRRINRGLFRKGLKSIEVKYYQNIEATDQANTGSNILYGINESVLQANANAFPLTAKVNCSSGINQGTGRNERIGNKIFIRHLRIRGGVWASTDANAANECYVKIMVLRVKEGQGTPTSAVTTTPTADNVFDSINTLTSRWTGSGVNSGPLAGSSSVKAKVMLNFTNVWKYLHARWGNDFQVLKSKVIKVSKETGVNSEKKLFKMNIPIFKPAHWDGTTSTDPQDGHILIYYWCDQPSQDPVLALASMAPTRPQMGFSWRLSYTDC